MDDILSALNAMISDTLAATCNSSGPETNRALLLTE